MICYVPSFSAILFIQAKFIGEELNILLLLFYIFEFVSVRGEFEVIIQCRIRENIAEQSALITQPCRPFFLIEF